MKRQLSSVLDKQDGFWCHVTSQHMQPLSSHPYLARLFNYYVNIQKYGMLQPFFFFRGSSILQQIPLFLGPSMLLFLSKWWPVWSTGTSGLSTLSRVLSRCTTGLCAPSPCARTPSWAAAWFRCWPVLVSNMFQRCQRRWCDGFKIWKFHCNSCIMLSVCECETANGIQHQGGVVAGKPGDHEFKAEKQQYERDDEWRSSKAHYQRKCWSTQWQLSQQQWLHQQHNLPGSRSLTWAEPCWRCPASSEPCWTQLLNRGRDVFHYLLYPFLPNWEIEGSVGFLLHCM